MCVSNHLHLGEVGSENFPLLDSQSILVRVFQDTPTFLQPEV